MNGSAGPMIGSVAGSPGSDRHELSAVLAAMRSRAGVLSILLAAAGAAWFSTAVRMAGMDGGPGTDLGALGWFTGVWVVMMAAMMLPSLTPAAAVYATLTGRREPSRWLLFAGGYLLAWSAAGVVAYALFELGKNLVAGDLAWRSGGRWFAAGVLALAVIYQFTPLKGTCLAKCRRPLSALRGGWREGRCRRPGTRRAQRRLVHRQLVGADERTVRARSDEPHLDGARGSARGLEKVVPWPRAATIATATVLAALAVGILAAPHELPGLVVPGAPTTMHDMKAMG